MEDDNVVQLPTRQRHRRPAQHFYRAAEKSDLAVWRVCAYVRKATEHKDDCGRCTAWEDDAVAASYARIGKVKQMCRAVAEEAIAVVLEELAHGNLDVVEESGDG